MTDEYSISNQPDQDRINNLPDDIVCHILSFLSTEKAALTSVLSKRWRNLFAFTPNLYFDDLNNRNSKNNYTAFRKFVDRILAVSSNSLVKKFTLLHRQKFDAPRVNLWICNALSRGVLDLDLFLILKNGYSLPLEIFTCKTLVRLKLGSLFGIAMVPDNASLPALKTLVLGSIQFYGCAFEALISACHVLKELTIIGNPWDREHCEKCCTVSCPTLERLIINFKAFNTPRNIAFDTPNLTYLDYCDYVADEYPTVNIKSLVEAKISLGLWGNTNKSNPTNLIKGLRNVEILNLSSYETSKIFYSFAEAIPVFEKLSRLSITTNSGPCWKLVPLLLKNSPNLQTLVIKGPLHYYDDKRGQKSKSVCECLSEYSFLKSCPVKVLEITEYSGSKSELEQMRHFMEKLSCLELVKVRVCATSTFPFATADLLKLPSACKIQLKFLPYQNNYIMY